MVGLGEEALSKRGYKKMFLIAEDYCFPYSQVQGFMTEYCAEGGKVVDKAWVPLGGKDYSSVIAQIPKDVDALVVVLGGADAVNFLTQYEQAGGDKPMIGGSITVDQTVLNYNGKRRESLVGTLSAGPIADSIDTPEWKKFVAELQDEVPGRLPESRRCSRSSTTSTRRRRSTGSTPSRATCGGQKKYRDALPEDQLKGPVGDIKIDENRQASARRTSPK